jgi:hypothetical protein
VHQVTCFQAVVTAGSVVIMGFLVVDVVSRLDPYTILCIVGLGNARTRTRGLRAACRAPQ